MVRAAVRQLAVSVRSATGVECSEEDMEVEVDRAGEVVLVGLGDYEATTSPELWGKFVAVSVSFEEGERGREDGRKEGRKREGGRN